jgi:iron complex transport system substrate-binding protein
VNRIKKKIGMLGGWLLLLLLVSSALLVPVLASPYPYDLADTEVANALAYIRSQQGEDGDVGGFGPSAWVVMAIVAAGEDPHDWKVGDNSIVDYLADNASEANLATDYARMVLAIVAASENPAAFGGRNFLSLLQAAYDGTQIGDSSLLNDDFWGVIALVAAGVSPSSEIVQNSVSFIKSCQQADGGWGFDPSASWGTDVDSTSAAITALVAAGGSASPNTITNGLAYIKSTQVGSGGFNCPLWGQNADLDSMAINAIVTAGQDPTSASWTRNGNTPVDDLQSFQQGDGSFYWQSNSPGAWPCQTTAWAIQALLGEPHPVRVLEPEEVITWNFPSTSDVFLAPTPKNGRPYLDTMVALPTYTEPPELSGVYWLDEATGDWLYFVPDFGGSTLTSLEPGEAYLVAVSGLCSWNIQ